MKNNFNDCLNRVLQDEGGYCNTPGDRGGPTKYGITIEDVGLYVKKNPTAKDVKNLTLDQATDIYRSKYWNALNCDNLASGVDYTCFDYGVNSGLGRPRRALQRFKDKSGVELIDAINDERVAFLRALGTKPDQSKFLKGWLSRVNRVRLYSEQLAKKDNVTGPITGAGAGGIGVTIAHFWQAHQSAIIVSSIIGAILIGTIVHYIRNKGKAAPLPKGK